jgi:hypothetical protein
MRPNTGQWPRGPPWSWFLSPWPQPGFVDSVASTGCDCSGAGGLGGALAAGCPDVAGDSVGGGTGAGDGFGAGFGFGVGFGLETGWLAPGAGMDACGAAVATWGTPCSTRRLLCRIGACGRGRVAATGRPAWAWRSGATVTSGRLAGATRMTVGVWDGSSAARQR